MITYAQNIKKRQKLYSILQAELNQYLYSVLSGVTIEAEGGITIYGQCGGQVKLAHCTLNQYQQ